MAKCLATTLIQVAEGEIGYREKKSNSQLDEVTANAGSNNWTKYARDFDSKYPNWYNGKKNGFAWCDMFVDWCFLTAFGYEEALRLLCQPEKSAGAGCTYSRRYYANKGQFHASNPQVGDQIFFRSDITSTSDECSHTGIVYKVDETTVYTIEGNASDQVKKLSYSLGSKKIVGYGRPAYDDPRFVQVQMVRNMTTGSDPKAIWDYLIERIGNPIGVAALMGNLYAESGLSAINLQNAYEKKLNYGDATYTAAVDGGTYKNFVKDSAGYGLAQWTFWSRKQALYEYASSKQSSIGNLETQLEFLYKELKESFPAVLVALRNATSVEAASTIVLTKFERPANMGDSVQKARAGYGQKYYDQFAKASTNKQETPTTGNTVADPDVAEGKAIYEKLNAYTRTMSVPAGVRGEWQECIDLGLTDGSNPCQMVPAWRAFIVALRAYKKACGK